VNVVLLGEPALRLRCVQSLSSQLFQVTEPVDLERIFGQYRIHFLVSYGYRYIVPQKFLEKITGVAVNLHIGFLPYNRGAHPNLWANLEDTPSGITIHKMTSGIDEGPILLQEKILVHEESTFRESYESLSNSIEFLFEKNCEALFHNQLPVFRQVGKGTYHRLRDFDSVKPLMDSGWDTVIKNAKQGYLNQLTSNGQNGLCCIHSDY
jgi:methionyl-tRNA formyltransferase